MKYRKKPVVIEAYQLTQDHVETHIFDETDLPPGLNLDGYNAHPWRRELHRAIMSVITIHGQRTRVEFDDWIVTEPDGEHYYPVKPDIFEQTYEAVE